MSTNTHPKDLKGKVNFTDFYVEGWPELLGALEVPPGHVDAFMVARALCRLKSDPYMVTNCVSELGGWFQLNHAPTSNVTLKDIIFQLPVIYAKGAEKYGDKSYLLPSKLTLWAEAAERHFVAFVAGEWSDPEFGTCHLANVFANLLIIQCALNNNSLQWDQTVDVKTAD